MRRTWLPARPIGVAGPRGGLLPIAVMLAIAGGCGYAAADALLDLGRVAHEQLVWDTGAVGARPVVTLREDSRLAVSSHLDVGYADSDGVFQTHTRSFSLIGLGVERDHPAVVHYYPGDPSDFAVNWALEVRDARWRYSVVGGVVFSVGALLALVAAVALAGRRVRRRWVARTGNEVSATVVSIRQRGGRQRDLFDVAWRIDASARPVMVTVVDSRKGTLAWLPGRPNALAIVSADGSHGILLRSDLYPLALPADERAVIIAALEAAGGGAIGGPLVAS